MRRYMEILFKFRHTDAQTALAIWTIRPRQQPLRSQVGAYRKEATKMVGAVSESETGSESPTLLGNLTPLLPRSRICCLDPVPASLPPPLADTRSIEGRREKETGRLLLLLPTPLVQEGMGTDRACIGGNMRDLDEQTGSNL